VAHTYNPSYSRSREQEDPGKLVLKTLSQKYPTHTHKKKKKKKERKYPTQKKSLLE
jgi:hypothetical protein